jgi:hypothetical protein
MRKLLQICKQVNCNKVVVKPMSRCVRTACSQLLHVSSLEKVINYLVTSLITSHTLNSKV